MEERASAAAADETGCLGIDDWWMGWIGRGVVDAEGKAEELLVGRWREETDESCTSEAGRGGIIPERNDGVRER